MGVGDGTMGGVGVCVGEGVGVDDLGVGVGEGTIFGVGVSVGRPGMVGIGVTMGVDVGMGAGVGVIWTKPVSLICPLGLIEILYPEWVPRRVTVAGASVRPVTVANAIGAGTVRNHTVGGKSTDVTGVSPSVQLASTVYP